MSDSILSESARRQKQRQKIKLESVEEILHRLLAPDTGVFNKALKNQFSLPALVCWVGSHRESSLHFILEG